MLRLDAVVDADGRPVERGFLTRWFRVLEAGDRPLVESTGASIVLDQWGYQLHLGDSGATHEGEHPGDGFVRAAVAHGVDVYVVDTERHDVDLRRDLPDAVPPGSVLGGRVRAFEIAVR